jgi:hypothetical protein
MLLQGGSSEGQGQGDIIMFGANGTTSNEGSQDEFEYEEEESSKVITSSEEYSSDTDTVTSQGRVGTVGWN